MRVSTIHRQTFWLARSGKAGSPHWWPDVGAGSPVVAEGQAAHYEPIRLILAALLSAPAAFMTEVGICVALAGLGTYLFLRTLKLGRWASTAGAISRALVSNDGPDPDGDGLL